MTTPQALKLFEALARQRGLDLAGDSERFFRLKTARAWGAYYKANCK